MTGKPYQEYFIRPAVKGKEFKLYHPAWPHKGDCTFLTIDGCELPLDKRPENCRMLEAIEPGLGKCELRGYWEGNPKRCAVGMWEPYNDLIDEIATEVEEDPEYKLRRAEAMQERRDVLREESETIPVELSTQLDFRGAIGIAAGLRDGYWTVI